MFTGYNNAVMNSNEENVFLSERLIGHIKNTLNPIKKIKADMWLKTSENKVVVANLSTFTPTND